MLSNSITACCICFHSCLVHIHKEQKSRKKNYFFSILQTKKLEGKKTRGRRAKEEFHNGKYRNVYTNQTDFKNSNVVIGVIQHSSCANNSNSNRNSIPMESYVQKKRKNHKQKPTQKSENKIPKISDSN